MSFRKWAAAHDAPRKAPADGTPPVSVAKPAESKEPQAADAQPAKAPPSK